MGSERGSGQLYEDWTLMTTNDEVHKEFNAAHDTASKRLKGI